jgi:hypothetical protein
VLNARPAQITTKLDYEFRSSPGTSVDDPLS